MLIVSMYGCFRTLSNRLMRGDTAEQRAEPRVTEYYSVKVLTRYGLRLNSAKDASAVYADYLEQIEECASVEFAGEVDDVEVGGRWEDVESERQPPK